MNQVKTAVLLAAMTALFGGVGLLIGGTGGMIVALLVAAGMNLFSYWNADKIVLRMYGAKEIDANAASGALRRYVEGVHALADRAGMPRPKVYLIETEQPNAFATGRNPENAAVAVTTGLLGKLNEREVMSVMAHELAHVKNRDTLTMTVTATIAGAISMLANFAFFFGGNRNNGGGIVGAIAIMILAPLAASLVQMAISRSREYEADRVGAEISGDPLALASALAKISSGVKAHPFETAERAPATGQMMIMNPLSGQRADNLFSTHPATGNRIDQLKAIARATGAGPASGSDALWRDGVAEPGAGPWG